MHFVLAAYAITLVVLALLVGSVWRQHRATMRRLSRLLDDESGRTASVRVIQGEFKHTTLADSQKKRAA